MRFGTIFGDKPFKLGKGIEEFQHATGRFGCYTVDRTVKSLEDM